ARIRYGTRRGRQAVRPARRRDAPGGRRTRRRRRAAAHVRVRDGPDGRDRARRGGADADHRRGKGRDPVIDFELIIPDGFLLLPTTPDTAKLRRRLIDELIRRHLPDSLPRDKAGPWRRMLRQELTNATDDAARHGARSV